MSHFPTGSYVLFDNLDIDSRFVMNALLEYDTESKQKGMYMKYLYINTSTGEILLDMWELNLLEIESDLNHILEWGTPKIKYSFDDALSEKYVTLNGIAGTWKEQMPKLEKSKKLRNVVFATEEVKILKKIKVSDSFSLEFRLVCDENTPRSDEQWDILDHIKLRPRLMCDIQLKGNKRISILFDKGRRGFPSINPINWYPTREMDGALISKEKAFSVDMINYTKPL